MGMKLPLVVFVSLSSFLVVKGRFEVADNLREAPKNLKYAFIIFRHGIRGPINNIYGSDDEYNKVWPEGRAQLTEDGKKLMLHVGRTLKTRYKNLIPVYDVTRVRFTSTKSPRTKMSAQLVAQGMFQPGSEDAVITQEIPGWQPIPVFEGMDCDKNLLFDQKLENSMCPRYTKIRDSIIDEEMKLLPAGKKRAINNINKRLPQSNSPIKEIKTLDDLFNVWDVYFMEEVSAKKLDGNIKPVMRSMTDLGQFRLWSRMHGKEDDGKSILQYYTGPILDTILEKVSTQHSECSKNPNMCPFIHLHGSHDLTVSDLVWALADGQEKFMAEPGDTLILEAYEDLSLRLFLYSPLNSKKKFKELVWKDCHPGNKRAILSKLGPTLSKVLPASLLGKFSFIKCHLDTLQNVLKKRGLLFSEEEWKRKCSKMDRVEQCKWRKIP